MIKIVSVAVAATVALTVVTLVPADSAEAATEPPRQVQLSVAPVPSWTTAGPALRNIYAGGGAIMYVSTINHPRIAIHRYLKGKWIYTGSVARKSKGPTVFTLRPGYSSYFRFAGFGNPRAAVVVSKPVKVSVSADRGRQVVAEAAKHSGKPYVFGTKGPRAFDCSGLTMAVYGKFGKRLPHSATAQGRYGKAVSKKSIKPGDLMLFGRPGRYYHAAIYAGGNMMYDAPRPGQRVGKHRIWTSGYTVRRLV